MQRHSLSTALQSYDSPLVRKTQPVKRQSEGDAENVALNGEKVPIVSVWAHAPSE